MLRVELPGRGLREAGHFQLVDRKASVLDGVDDLSHLSVAVGLYHSEGALARRFKMLASVHITVVENFEDAREDSDLGTQEEIVQSDGRNLLLFQENA